MGFFDLFGGPKYQRVSVQAAQELVEAGAQFIDVRGHGEFKAAHAAGAKNIALGSLEAQIKNLDSSKPVVCICQMGGRSAMAAKKLAKSGFTDVYNVTGGTIAWQRAGLPMK